MKVYAIRPAANEEAPQEVEVVEYEQGVDISTEKVVARGYLRVAFAATPEPGADVRAGVDFVGMGLEQ